MSTYDLTIVFITCLFCAVFFFSYYAGKWVEWSKPNSTQDFLSVLLPLIVSLFFIANTILYAIKLGQLINEMEKILK